jgi:hypothetical protein
MAYSDLGVGKRVGPVLAGVHLSHAASVNSIESGVVAFSIDLEPGTVLCTSQLYLKGRFNGHTGDRWS